MHADFIEDYFIGETGNYLNHLPMNLIAKLQQQKYFKMLLPQQWGGLGLTIAQTLPLLRKVAYTNGSLGWLVQIGNGGTYFAPYLNNQIAENLFSNENAVLAGSGASTGTAIPVNGGYQVTGNWNYCSGADYATFFTVNCEVVGSKQIISCVLMPQQVTVKNTWQTTGLKNTSTHYIKVKEAFVPHAYVFSLNQPLHADEFANMQMPFMPFAQLYFMQTFFGIAHRLFVEIKNLAEERAEAWQKRSDSIAEKCYNAIDYLNTMVVLTQQVAEGISQNHQLAEIDAYSILVKEVKQKIMLRAHELYLLAGMVVLNSHHVVHVFYHDLIAAGQHGLLNNYTT